MKHAALGIGAFLLCLAVLATGFHYGSKSVSPPVYIKPVVVLTPRPVTFADEQRACFEADHQNLQAILTYVAPQHRAKAKRALR